MNIRWRSLDCSSGRFDNFRATLTSTSSVGRAEVGQEVQGLRRVSTFEWRAESSRSNEVWSGESGDQKRGGGL
jgi:hypothetical protein